MASIKQPSSRYNSFDPFFRSSTQSNKSHASLSSSADLNNNRNSHNSSGSCSIVAVKAKPSDATFAGGKLRAANSTQKSSTTVVMVKKFLEKRSSASKAKKGDSTAGLIVPADFIAEDLKKTMGRKGSGSNLSTLVHKKLFGKGVNKEEQRVKKALTEVKANTRTLAMVLRSERELLSFTKEQEAQIAELNLMLEQKNREVEKLKDLCLKQREELKSLKNAVLFPDVMNSGLQDLLEKQGSELKQAKQFIPSLQKQVTTLTGQLHCFAEDLAEVKADKYSARTCPDNHVTSPRTPVHEQEAANSLELFSSCDQTTAGSPDGMFLKDFNPCLTPHYAKTKKKEFELYDSPQEEILSANTRKLSKSSNCCKCLNSGGSSSAYLARKSNESKFIHGRQQLHQQFF